MPSRVAGASSFLAAFSLAAGSWRAGAGWVGTPLGVCSFAGGVGLIVGGSGVPGRGGGVCCAASSTAVASVTTNDGIKRVLRIAGLLKKRRRRCCRPFQ